MFLEIEGSQLLNLAILSRIELRHGHEQVARCYNGAVLEAESGIVYRYLTDPRNRLTLYCVVPAEGPSPEMPEPDQEVIAKD